MTFELRFILVTISMIAADVAWTYYFIKVDERQSIAAGLWSSAIILFGAFTAVNYVGDSRLIFAAVLGSFIGTATTVEYKKRKENKHGK